MISSLIFLTSKNFGDQLSPMFRAFNQNLSIITVNTNSDLYAIDRSVLLKSRLISFLSTVIVPSEILALLKHGAYNFHPAPPSRPGWGALNFAIYHDDDYFGTTLHKMIEYVDAGPIINIDIFLIPKNGDLEQISQMTRESLSRLINKSASDLILLDGDLPIMPFTWGTQKYSKIDYVEITHFKPDIKKTDLYALIKAFGEKGNVAQLRFVMNDEIYFFEPVHNHNTPPDVVEYFLHGYRFTPKTNQVLIDV